MVERERCATGAALARVMLLPVLLPRIRRTWQRLAHLLRVTTLAEPPFTIAADGDVHERRYWSLFAAEAFPSYEVFWAAEIAPLIYRTRDRKNLYFQNHEELEAIGKTSEDVTVAQLHYTLLLHLGRMFDLLEDPAFDRYSFAESFVALTGASDVGDELLQRRKTPGVYPAWDEQEGSRARRDWRDAEGDPLRDIRAYRNRLVHGRVVPEVHVERRGLGLPTKQTLEFPRIEKVDDYLDWRMAQDPARSPFVVNDFREGRSIVRDAWERVVSHTETAWQTHLLTEG